MKRIITLGVVLVLFVTKAFPCLNYYYATTKEGKAISLGDDWKVPYNKNFNPERNESKLKKLEAQLKKEHNYMLLSDYGVCLLKLGKTQEALEIFVELYKHYPNEYKIAANLGTAYELSGQVDSALKYIKRDMELNPNDHDGSEWVHVKVLEAKQQLAKNPDYLKDHTVLGLTEKQKNDTMVLKQLSIQLQERMPFSPEGKNEIMASLFTDLGDICYNIQAIEYALTYYDIAEEYYHGDFSALGEKMKRVKKLKAKYAKVQPPSMSDSIEGDANMVGYIPYSMIVEDNDAGHYKVDWSKININVASLLAMVDFANAPQTPATMAGDKSDTLSKHNGPYQVEGAPAQPAPKNYSWFYVGGLLALVVVGYLVFSKMKRK